MHELLLLSSLLLKNIKYIALMLTKKIDRISFGKTPIYEENLENEDFKGIPMIEGWKILKGNIENKNGICW